jgi:hypothetical protein
MIKKEKRKEGGQKNNQNARKHGFYSKVLDAAEKRELKVAHDVSGIDDEIDLLRVKIQAAVGRDPENVRLLMAAVTTLAALLKARLDINKGQKRGLSSAFRKVIDEWSLPVAVNAASAIITKNL